MSANRDALGAILSRLAYRVRVGRPRPRERVPVRCNQMFLGDMASFAQPCLLAYSREPHSWISRQRTQLLSKVFGP
jgi:hypothetical protein